MTWGGRPLLVTATVAAVDAVEVTRPTVWAAAAARWPCRPPRDTGDGPSGGHERAALGRPALSAPCHRYRYDLGPNPAARIGRFDLHYRLEIAAMSYNRAGYQRIGAPSDRRGIKYGALWRSALAARRRFSTSRANGGRATKTAPPPAGRNL